MELILWRHAEAENGYPDAARQLTNYGLNQAQKISVWLNEKIPDETRIIVSPAQRAQQTVKALRRDFETSPEIAVGASVSDILSVVGWPESRGAILVVGHQPTLGEVAEYLLTNLPADFDFRPGTVGWISCWNENGMVNSKLKAVTHPEML